MKYIERVFHLEMIPETEDDVQYLKKTYPHLWPFDHVCVAHPPVKMRWSFAARRFYDPR